jgi:phosphatidylserine/phosphatidylglycerophosphate/cardiolipin synthase-like enzyme
MALCQCAQVGSSGSFDDWFLTPSERGNPATFVDQGLGGRAWSEGNDVTVLVDGGEYFPVLCDALNRTGRGDWIYLTDLQGDGDERLAGAGTEIGTLLAHAARRGVNVRGLLWRSHPVGHGGAQTTNLTLSRKVNEAGGDVVLDHRVRRGGSHHQKLVVIHRNARAAASAAVAFVGGIDLAHGRNDAPPHHGDVQALDLGDSRYGDRPPWHDVQLRVRGPAVHQLSWTFRERWLDPQPLDRRTPLAAMRRVLSRKPRARGALAEPNLSTTPCGPHAVQVLRTYPQRRPRYPFAPKGERSIARAYIKAFTNATQFVYLEDQYLWSLDATRALCAALQRNPQLRCVIVIPRYPDPAGILGSASRFGRWRVERALLRAGGERVALFDLENNASTPIYVHAKVCIIDDMWMTVGSDNLNRRSWTHDSEICCAVMDADRELPQETRIRLAHEHLDVNPAHRPDLRHPDAWFAALLGSARTLDHWHANGRQGTRPRGHLRMHPHDRVPRWTRPLLHVLHATLLDPDGRPPELHRLHHY